MKISKKTYNLIRIIGCILLLALMTAFLVYINVTDGGNMDISASPNGKYKDIDYFENFTLKSFSQDEFSNVNFEEYDVIIVNIWEPYCKSCLKEMPVLDELSSELKDKGLLVVEVQGNAYVYPEDVELGYDLIDDIGVSLPMLLADERFSKEILPILKDAFPGTFVLNKKGEILDFTAGSKSKEAWREYFESFIK
ncbi:MAG: TlpA family protein disulfide reductase [Lachnospiraceae bacterium]|nr:TlpA family protein disulfide reductase [Lachnospiraceae bacterium]